MKNEFSKNTTEVFTKTVFHYVPEILKYIDEIKDPRKWHDYSMRYLIISEMLMFLSEGKSQRFTETAYEETNYLDNIRKIIKQDVNKIPDAEIYTDVFSMIEEKEIEKFQLKALSNQRYRELVEAGFVVGLETGDIKSVPKNCEFLCCTQEIYTNKYAEVENAILIMDEFHYIFESSDRARTYVDALQKSKTKNILLCSATLGDLSQLTEYVEKVSSREFCTYENHSFL